MKINKKLLIDLGMATASIAWGSTFFLVKEVIDLVNPVMIVAYRFIIATFLLGIILAYYKRNFLPAWRQGAVLGVLAVFIYLPQTIGLEYTTASNSGFITGTFVLFVPIFLLIFFKKLPSFANLIAMIVSLVGLWILTGGIVGINHGDILTLLSALASAAHILIADKYLNSKYDPYILCFWQFLTAGVIALAINFIFDLPFNFSAACILWPVIIYLSIFPTLLAFIMQLIGQKIVKPVRASLIFSLEPVFAALFAWWLGGEVFVFSRAVGGLLIFIAIIISELGLIEKNSKTRS